MPCYLRNTLLSIFTLASIPTFAQPAAFERGTAPQIQYNSGIPVTGSPATLRADAQLRAQSHYRLLPGAAAPELLDSTVYRYSGGRAGDPLAMLQFDTQEQYLATGPAQRSVQTFNADNTVSGYLTQRLDSASGEWTNLSRYAIVHRDHFRLADSSWGWEPVTQGWTPSSYTVRELDDAGRPLLITRFIWSKERAAFDSGSQLRSRYDAAGNLVERVLSFGVGHLSPSSRHRYAYNDRNAATSVRTDRWDSGSATWVPVSAQVFELNANDDRISQTNLEPAARSGDLIAVGTYIYRYDGRRNVVEMTGSGDRIRYSYDSRGFLTGMTRSSLRNGEMRESRRYYYAATPTAVTELTAPAALSIWPIPASGELHLDAAAIRGTVCSIEIANMDGRLVQRSRQAVSSAIDISALPSGTYLLKVLPGTGTALQGRFSVVK